MLYGFALVAVTGIPCVEAYSISSRRNETPFAPWRDDPDRGIQRHVGQFKADLVVPFSGRPMRDRVGAFLAGKFDLPTRNSGRAIDVPSR